MSMSAQVLVSDAKQDGLQFVTELAREAAQHRAANHPYLEALAAGDVPDPAGALADLARQYYVYSADFVRYLSATIGQLEYLPHRAALVRNLTEESGVLSEHELEEVKAAGVDPAWVQGVPHPVLFRRFLDALGMTEAWLSDNPPCDDAVIWSRTFHQCCTAGGPAQAVGALGLGTELIVPQIYRPILRAIIEHLDVSPRERVFFDLHTTVDDAHGEVLLEIAADLATQAEHRAPLRLGMQMALHLRSAFFDAMHRRALAMPMREVK
ncbi:MAG: iron-containing redox enzyme family protein [Myxococcales bacterium]|nr:iron-containing redox enzyme family protein [Myxococcales bacterium]